MMFPSLQNTALLGALASARARLLPRVAFLLASSLIPGHAAVAASCTALQSDAVRLGDSIALRVTPGLAATVVAEGINYWRSCANYEEGFPKLIVGGAGTQTLEIRYLSSRGDAACGVFQGRTITLYGSARAPDGSRFHCGSLAQNLAHELGHALGLRDAPEGAGCRRQIMSRLNPSNRQARSVDTSECQAVGQRWLTRLEHRKYEDIQQRVFGGSP